MRRQSSRPAAILFDFDGVIADSETLHYLGFVQSALILGVELTRDIYDADMIGFDDVSGMSYLRDIALRNGADIRDKKCSISLLCELKENFVNNQLADVPLVDGAREVYLSALSAYPTAIVSGALRSEIETILDAQNLPRPQIIVAAGDTDEGKPSPEPYTLGRKLLETDESHEHWVVEDTQIGAQAALSAGCNVCHLSPTSNPSLEQLAQNAGLSYVHKRRYDRPWSWQKLFCFLLLTPLAFAMYSPAYAAGIMANGVMVSVPTTSVRDGTVIAIASVTGEIGEKTVLQGQQVHGEMQGANPFTFSTEHATISGQLIEFPGPLEGTWGDGTWTARSGNWDTTILSLVGPHVEMNSFTVSAKFGKIFAGSPDRNTGNSTSKGNQFAANLTGEVAFETR